MIQHNMDVMNSYLQNLRGANSASMFNTMTKNSVGKNRQKTAGSNSLPAAKKKSDSGLFSMLSNKTSEEKGGVSLQMRHMIRELKQEQYAGSANGANSKNNLNGFSQLSGSPDAEEEEIISVPKYNYKAVATKIQQAKTSLSAGQAVLAAKRETLKIRRMISSGNGDPEELQIALTHAKRMEMVARKKKHHIELEELVRNTQKMDEELNRQEDAVVEMKNAIVSEKEEEVTEKEDEIFEARQEMLDHALEQLEETDAEFSEDELRELNEMFSEFGEEELEELEKSMEMLETMEVVDPHMSKEDFEDLKRKHRTSEDKAIVKANMEYLRDMIKHELGKSSSMTGIGTGSSGTLAAAGFAVPHNSADSFSAPQFYSAPSIDFQI